MTDIIKMIGNTDIVSDSFIIEYKTLIVLIATTSVLVNIIVLIATEKRKKRYIEWKETKINIFGWYQRTWERNDDKFMNELFDDNIRLEKENNLLKKRYTNLSISVTLILVISLIGIVLYSVPKRIVKTVKKPFTNGDASS